MLTLNYFAANYTKSILPSSIFSRPDCELENRVKKTRFVVSPILAYYHHYIFIFKWTFNLYRWHHCHCCWSPVSESVRTSTLWRTSPASPSIGSQSTFARFASYPASRLFSHMSSRLCHPPSSLGRRWRSWTGSCRAPTMTPSTACSKSMLPNVMVPNSMPTVTPRRVCSWWWHVMHIICTKESLACSMLQVSINSTMTNTVFQMIQMLVGTHALKMATDSLQLETSGPDIVVL